MFLLWDKNVVKMDLSLKTPIVTQLDVNMILFPSQIWPGTIEKKNQSEWLLYELNFNIFLRTLWNSCSKILRMIKVVQDYIRSA